MGERRGLLVAATLAIGAACLVVFATQGRPGLSYDSVVYASTLRVRQASDSWSFSALWPPGLAAVVVVVGTGWGIVLVNTVACAANVLVTYVLGLRAGLPNAWSLALAGVVAFSAATAFTFVMLWSEPLFVVAINLALLALVTIWHERRLSPRWCAVLVLAVNTAALLRFAALPMIALAGVVVVVVGARSARRGGAAAGVLIAAFCTLGFVAVALWNISQGSPPTGPRQPSQFDVIQVALYAFHTVGAFLLNTGGGAWLILPGVLACAAVAAFVVRRPRFIAVDDAVVPVVAWVAVYFAFIIVSSLTTWIDVIGFRLLLPGQSAALVVLGAALHRARTPVTFAVVYAAAVATSTVVQEPWSSNLDYSRDVVRWEQEAAAIDDAVPAGATIVSDDPHGLAWVTGRDEIRGFPDAGPRPPAPYFTHGNRLADTRPGDYIVILDGGDAPPDLPAADRVASGRGYVVYRAR